MSVPITLAISDFTKSKIGASESVALVTQMGETVAILRDPEVYDNRKEEVRGLASEQGEETGSPPVV